jgi:HEAT repeat protein
MYAEHPMPEARSDAVYVLRFYAGEKAENILIHALANDHDATTRREAATSLGYMEAGDRVVAALEAAYASEQIDKIRVEIVKSLWKFERKYPAIRQLLERAGEKDESEEVRKTIHGILNDSGGGS